MNKELEEAKQNLIQQLENTKKANECGLATKGEFNKDIQALETVLNYIDNSISKEVIEEKLMKYFDINTNNCMAYNLTRVKEAREYGTLTIDDFVEFDEDTINDIVNYIFNK